MKDIFGQTVEKLYGLIGHGDKCRPCLKTVDGNGKETRTYLDALHDPDELLHTLGFEIDDGKFPYDKIYHPRRIIPYIKFYRTRYLPRKYFPSVESGDNSQDEVTRTKADADQRITELDNLIEELKKSGDARLANYMRAFREYAQDGGVKAANKLAVVYRDVDRYNVEEGKISDALKNASLGVTVPTALMTFYWTYKYLSDLVPKDELYSSIITPLVSTATGLLSAYLPYRYLKNHLISSEERENRLREQEMQIFADALVSVTKELNNSLPDVVKEI